MNQAEFQAALALGLSGAAFVLSCVGAWPHIQQGFVVIRDVVLWVALAAVFLMLGGTFAVRWWPTPTNSTAGTEAKPSPAISTDFSAQTTVGNR